MTRLRGLALILIAALATAGLPARAAADAECAQQHRRIRVPDGFAQARLSFTGILSSGRSRVGDDFPLATLRELRVVVEWSELEDSHNQRVELYSPDGSLYQRFSRMFTGGRRPVSVTTRVPVSGSSITDSSLFGDWCVEVFLDDEEAPIARRPFTLTAP